MVVALVTAFAGAAFIALLWRMVCRPAVVLYLLAFVVSFVGVNVHYGATIYLSRLMMACFLLVLLLRWLLRLPNGPHLRLDVRLAALWLGTIAVQTVSTFASDGVGDSLRQLFIYLGAMAVFLTVVALGDSSAKIVRALRFYLAAGVVQGLYGIYQVVGGPRGWPTYQSLLAAVPMANDRTDGGYYFSGGYGVFRAVGFFSGDVSHYSGYMAGVLLIALAFLAYGKRTVLPYAALVFGGAGLVFSLSRSGIVAFAVVGLPVIGALLHSRRFISLMRMGRVGAKWAVAIAILLAAASTIFGGNWWANSTLPDIGPVLSARLMNLVQSEDSPGFESMALHIRTRMLALDAFRSSPLIGVGLGITATPWHSVRYDQDWSGAHSHHFNILGETGALGAVLEWMFMAIVLRQMLRGLRLSPRRSLEQAVMVGLLAAYLTILIGNFLYSYYTNDFVWFLMGCGWSLSVAIKREAERRETIVRESGQPMAQSVAC